MEVTCKQGGRHRWDEADARCLDYGRPAEECADELHEWLVETEDRVDRMADERDVAALCRQAAADIRQMQHEGH